MFSAALPRIPSIGSPNFSLTIGLRPNPESLQPSRTQKLFGSGDSQPLTRRRRPRRPLPGMLLHIDGSKHCWFQNSQRYDLIVILDDATSEIYYAQLVEEESTRTVMAGLCEVIETKGLFCALYSDRGSHFFHTSKAGEPVNKQLLTQVGRAMKELGLQVMP